MPIDFLKLSRGGSKGIDFIKIIKGMPKPVLKPAPKPAIPKEPTPDPGAFGLLNIRPVGSSTANTTPAYVPDIMKDKLMNNTGGGGSWGGSNETISAQKGAPYKQPTVTPEIKKFNENVKKEATDAFARGALPADIEKRKALATENILRISRDVRVGGLGVVKTTAKGLEWITPKSMETNIAKYAEDIETQMDVMAVENPTLLDGIAQGAGSAAVFVLLGGVVGMGVKGVAVLNTVLTGTEALSEAGGVYDEVMKKTGNRQEANERAGKTFVANALLIGITNKYGILGGGTVFKKAIMSFINESGQEAAQQMIQNTQTGKNLMDGVLEAGLIGGILGVPMGMVLGQGNKIDPSVVKRLIEEKFGGGEKKEEKPVVDFIKLDKQVTQNRTKENVAPAIGFIINKLGGTITQTNVTNEFGEHKPGLEYAQKYVGNGGIEIEVNNKRASVKIVEDASSINMPGIAAKEAGTKLGSKMLDSLKEYADSIGKEIHIYNVTSPEYFDKFNWLTKEAGEYVYNPNVKPAKVVAPKLVKPETIKAPKPVEAVQLPKDDIEMVDYLKKKYPKGITLHHQTSAKSKEDIMKNGFTGENDDNIYFSAENFDKQRGTSGGNQEVISIKISPEDYGQILADEGTYQGGSDQEKIADMFKQGFVGADITLPSYIANKYIKKQESEDRPAPKKQESETKPAYISGQYGGKSSDTYYIKEFFDDGNGNRKIGKTVFESKDGKAIENKLKELNGSTESKPKLKDVAQKIEEMVGRIINEKNISDDEISETDKLLEPFNLEIKEIAEQGDVVIGIKDTSVSMKEAQGSLVGFINTQSGVNSGDVKTTNDGYIIGYHGTNEELDDVEGIWFSPKPLGEKGDKGLFRGTVEPASGYGKNIYEAKLDPREIEYYSLGEFYYNNEVKLKLWEPAQIAVKKSPTKKPSTTPTAEPIVRSVDKIESAVVKKAIPVLKAFMNKKLRLPILESILIKNGQAVATDLERVIILNGFESYADGIYDIVGNELVKTGQNIDEYPQIPEVEGDVSAYVLSETLMKEFGRAQKFVTIKSPRIELDAVHLVAKNGNLSMTATDSFRLYEKNIRGKIDGDFDVLIEPTGISAAMKYMDNVKTAITIGKDSVEFANKYGKIVVRQITGNFPDVRTIYQSRKKQYSFDTTEMKAAIKEIRPFTKKIGIAHIVMTYSNGKIGLSTIENKINIDKTVFVEAKEKNINIAGGKKIPGSLVMPILHKTGDVENKIETLNIDFLEDAITSLEGDTGYMNIGEDSTPILITDNEIVAKEAPAKAIEKSKPKKQNLAKHRNGESKVGISSGSYYASKGDFNPIEIPEYNSHIELPEMVGLMKELLDGKVPFIRKYPSALGMFYANPADPRIGLSPKVFTDEDPNLPAKVLAHELGHAIDFLPEMNIKRGNLLNRLESLVHVRAGIFGQEVDVKRRKQVMANINNYNKLERDKGLSVEQSLKRDKYIEEFNQLNEKLIIDKEYREELKGLTQFWKPFNDKVNGNYKSYRYSSVELYADFVSILFNRPDLAMIKAPKFYKRFFDFLDKKPEVAKAYFELMDYLTGSSKEEILDRREADLRGSFETAADIQNRKTAELISISPKQRASKLAKDLNRALVEKNQALIEVVNKAIAEGKQVVAENNPALLLEELDLLKNEISDVYDGIESIDTAISDAGMTDIDFSTYLFYKRIADGDRAGVANPKGHTPKTAADGLARMKEKLGDKYGVLEKAAEKLNVKYREELKSAMEAGVISEELYTELTKEQTIYATFQMLDYTLSGQVSANIMHQIGSFKDIGATYQSTIAKIVALRVAGARNTFKKTTGEFLIENIAGDERLTANIALKDYGRIDAKIDPRTGGAPQYKTTSSGARLELITWRNDGKLTGIYVDPEIARSFKYDSSAETRFISETIGLINNAVFRKAYIDYSIRFILRNPIRDGWQAWEALSMLDLQGTGAFNVSFRKFLAQYPKAWREARAFAKGEKTETIGKILDNKILGVDEDYKMTKEEIDESTALSREMVKRGLKLKGEKPSKNPLLGLGKFVVRTGQTNEAITKIMAYQMIEKELAKRGQTINKETAAFIRNNIGTPNWRKGGSITPTTNVVAMFSNVAIQGYKRSISLYKDPNTRSGYAWKQAKSSVLLKVLMWAAAAGLMGDDLKKQYDRVSTYDKSNYIVIPFGITPKGKTRIIKIPMDYTDRIINAVIWNVLESIRTKELNPSATFNLIAGEMPQLSQIIILPIQWWAFARGLNPRDNFTGQNVLNDKEFQAGGMYALMPMLKYSWNQVLGGIIKVDVRERLRDQSVSEKVANLPGINAFYGEVDYGLSEKINKDNQKLNKKNAIENLKEDSAIMGQIKKYYKDDVEEDKIDKYILKAMFENKEGEMVSMTDQTEFRKKFMTALLKTYNNSALTALVYSNTVEQQIGAIKTVHNAVDQKQFAEIQRLMLNSKLISQKTWSEAITQIALPPQQ